MTNIERRKKLINRLIGFEDEEIIKRHNSNVRYDTYVLSPILTILTEGVDFNYTTRKIRYNPNHEDNIGTSDITNPVLNTKLIPKTQIWSIFNANIMGEKMMANL